MRQHVSCDCKVRRSANVGSDTRRPRTEGLHLAFDGRDEIPCRAAGREAGRPLAFDQQVSAQRHFNARCTVEGSAGRLRAEREEHVADGEAGHSRIGNQPDSSRVVARHGRAAEKRQIGAIETLATHTQRAVADDDEFAAEDELGPAVRRGCDQTGRAFALNADGAADRDVGNCSVNTRARCAVAKGEERVGDDERCQSRTGRGDAHRVVADHHHLSADGGGRIALAGTNHRAHRAIALDEKIARQRKRRSQGASGVHAACARAQREQRIAELQRGQPVARGRADARRLLARNARLARKEQAHAVTARYVDADGVRSEDRHRAANLQRGRGHRGNPHPGRIAAVRDHRVADGHVHAAEGARHHRTGRGRAASRQSATDRVATVPRACGDDRTRIVARRDCPSADIRHDVSCGKRDARGAFALGVKVAFETQRHGVGRDRVKSGHAASQCNKRIGERQRGGPVGRERPHRNRIRARHTDLPLDGDGHAVATDRVDADGCIAQRRQRIAQSQIDCARVGTEQGALIAFDVTDTADGEVDTVRRD